ncbi:MAG: glycine betaine ABC transporter substrate-binding protein [Fusobacteriota bacterium]
MNKLRKMMSVVLILIVVGLSFGCNIGKSKEKEEEVRLTYVEWTSAIASTNIVKAVLKEKLNYEVDATPVTPPMMYEGLKVNEVDATVCAWLPTPQRDWYEAAKEDIVNLGPNMDETRMGLVVPDYVKIDKISEMANHKEKFDGKIIGIDAGAGQMRMTEEAMEGYGLEDFELVSGSGATMVGALKSAIDRGDWVAVVGWKPHWKFSRWDLKFLDDPDKYFGDAERIDTVVTKEFPNEKPKASKFLDNFKWTAKEMGEVMLLNRKEGTDPYENAKKWVNDNPEIIEKWLEGTEDLPKYKTD